MHILLFHFGTVRFPENSIEVFLQFSLSFLYLSQRIFDIIFHQRPHAFLIGGKIRYMKRVRHPLF